MANCVDFKFVCVRTNASNFPIQVFYPSFAVSTWHQLVFRLYAASASTECSIHQESVLTWYGNETKVEAISAAVNTTTLTIPANSTLLRDGIQRFGTKGWHFKIFTWSGLDFDETPAVCLVGPRNATGALTDG
ncbi:hypothetical protein HDU91_003807, partial [Kappamyces sp. JEL0680]